MIERERDLNYCVVYDVEYPTTFEVLMDLTSYGINPNRFDKLWRAHRHRLGERVCKLDGVLIPKYEQPSLKPKVFRDPRMYPILETQSGTAEAVTTTSGKMTMSENIKFSDQMDGYTYDVGGEMDPTRGLQDTDDADLGNFFQRPIKIHEVEWGTGISLFSSINPWTLFFENPRVINRMTNFNLLKSKLKVKIVINGNGFQYGRAIAHYHPLPSFDDLTTTAALNDDDIVQASQMPHVYLDPTTSQGGELVLPMFFYKNYMHVIDSDWQEMGNLIIRSINDLKHANGAVDKVTISVFAWAEDISMSVLTSVDPPTLVPQSGEVDEANTKGIISEPASAVAKISNAFTTIPVIGPFAMATSMAATTIGNIAKMFGYSRPNVTKAPEPFVPRVTGQFAPTNVPDNCLKLSVDHKQELTIDPRIAGLCSNEDQLAIKSIASRESYITKFPWVQGTAPETLLFNHRITPVTWAEGGGDPTPLRLTPSAVAALPFRYWTGSMKFRFQVVASTFHKGRLKIVYDPNILEASPEYNTNYIQIVDISETRDFTIEVGNGQAYSLIQHFTPGLDSVTNIYSTSRYTAVSDKANGVLGVYVVNELTTPNSTVNNDIEINVFVSMGDDFEVFVPNDDITNYVFKPRPVEALAGPVVEDVLEPQSGELEIGNSIVPESENTNEASKPMQETTMRIGPDLQDGALLNKVFTGESITSFRQMIKRYNLHTCVANNGSTPVVTQTQQGMFPYLRGDVAGAIHQTGTLQSYNYCNTIMIHWVTYVFSGWRGSTRWKLLPRGIISENAPITMYAQRWNRKFLDYDSRVGSLLSTLTPSEAGFSAVSGLTISNISEFAKSPNGLNGIAWTYDRVNPALEFEVPYYDTKRFEPGKRENLTEDLDKGFETNVYYDGNGTTAINYYVAAGEDFQPFFFTGMPRLFYEVAPPAP